MQVPVYKLNTLKSHKNNMVDIAESARIKTIMGYMVEPKIANTAAFSIESGEKM